MGNREKFWRKRKEDLGRKPTDTGKRGVSVGSFVLFHEIRLLAAGVPYRIV